MQETNYATDIAVVPSKSYIILKRRKRFALNKAGTRDRLDLGLRLTGCEATERLQDARGFDSGSITHIVRYTKQAMVTAKFWPGFEPPTMQPVRLAMESARNAMAHIANGVSRFFDKDY